jgi:argininosuccinate lyase
MRAAASSDLLLATDAADELAAKGIPFREAHEIVSREGKHSQSTVESVLAKKNVLGGTAPERVLAAAKAALEILSHETA